MKTTSRRNKINAATLLAYHKKVDNGKCVFSGCHVRAEAGKRMCRKHREQARRKTSDRIRNQKKNGLCQQPGCRNIPAPGRARCQPCLDYRKREDASTMAKGLCLGCRRVPALTNHRRCRECMIRRVADRWGTTVEVLKSIWTGVCPYSGRKLEIGVNAHLDHKIARCRGGCNKADNLQWVHAEVNLAKHKLTEEQFRQLITDCYQHRIKRRKVTSI